MNRKKILLTGAAGFIGANFLKRICLKKDIAENYSFVVLDSLTYAGHFPSIEKDLQENDHLSFVKMDIRESEKISQLFAEESFDGVLHFAAESHVDNSIKDPNLFVATNVMGTLNLLRASQENAKEGFRFLHVSTDEVYGTLGENDPAFCEETPLATNSPYSASKAGSDLLVRSYFHTFGLDTVITRCSNNYGPFQFPEKLIPLMIFRAQKDQELPVYGDGRNIRDWIYVEDHNEGVWAAFTKGKAGEVYNLGGASEKRNIEVVKTLLEKLKKPESLIAYVEDRKGHDWRYAINFSKAERELGWAPTVTFEAGLQKTIDWYIENPSWIEEVEKKTKFNHYK
ncbi:MAG: dTDP-glucose 4,6-dehydratase [Halobacteriovoraceae bacterium]|jgi:dTDP-glucose 4,6-dehydratase|nr:dTDP-glucose 4,6-dehydratase [Halobacteriovoraceae bacterium]